jgi:plastocyanin
MRGNRGRLLLAACIVLVFIVAGSPGADAVHWYRGPADGCTPADGELPVSPAPTPDATVLVLHDSYLDVSTGLPVTRISVGDSVRWEWWSSHCHSTEQGIDKSGTQLWDSGLHYPAADPGTPVLNPALFYYPVFDTTPTLSFTYTFSAAGTYTYFCKHHAAIGMRGVVIVE